MAAKRKRNDDVQVIHSADEDKQVVHSADALRTLLSSAITNYGSAEIALLHIMKTHDFDTDLLQQILDADGIDISLSNVKYEDIAPFVGLDPDLRMNDVETFYLHRSRIPTALFKSIMEDIDVMLVQYGPMIEHETEEARSRFLSPIFNRLISVFGFAFRNLPESTIKRYTITNFRVEYYFEAIGSIAVLVIEMKLKIGSAKERLDAIAQVIAECDVCDLYNVHHHGFRVLVYGILCDGDIFEFFLFDGTTEPFSFQRGVGLNAPTRRFRIPDPADTWTTRPFIHALRPICEIIFDLLLSAYVSSLKAYHNRAVIKNTRAGQLRKSLDKWEVAMSSATIALDKFRDAETKRRARLTDEANSIVQEAMAALMCSVGAIPILHRPVLIMSGWDDEEIETV